MVLIGSCGPILVLEVHGINKKSGSLGLKNRFSSWFPVFTVQPPGLIQFWKPWLLHLRVQIATLQLASSNYYTVQNSKTTAFHSLWEFQAMTKDLWNVYSKSTNLNHTFSRVIESFSKNSRLSFSSLLVFARSFHKTWEVIVLFINGVCFLGWWIIEPNAMNKKLTEGKIVLGYEKRTRRV